MKYCNTPYHVIESSGASSNRFNLKSLSQIKDSFQYGSHTEVNVNFSYSDKNTMKSIEEYIESIQLY